MNRRFVPLVVISTFGTFTLAAAQPARPVPRKAVKMSEIKLPASLSAKSTPISRATRDALRSSLATALKVPARSIPSTIRPASGQMSDPTGLDVGTSVKFSSSHWSAKVSTRGKATATVTSPMYISHESMWLTRGWRSSYTIQLSLPSTPTSQPQAYMLECEVAEGYYPLPPSLKVRTYISARSGQPLQSESLGPIGSDEVATGAQTGWLSVGAIVPPGPYSTLSLIISPMDMDDQEAVIRHCELARMH